MTLTITAEQRNALYEQISEGLSGVDGIWLAVRAENYEDADRLARQYSDGLRLICDDLGWGERPEDRIELRTPPDVLRRVLGRLRNEALAREASEQQERAEARESERRNQLVAETCRLVLADLDGP